METPTHLGLQPELNPTLETVRWISNHLAKEFYGCGYHENYTARVEQGRTRFVAWVCCLSYLTQLLEIHLSTQRFSTFEGGRAQERKKGFQWVHTDPLCEHMYLPSRQEECEAGIHRMLKRYICYFPNRSIIHVKLDYPSQNSLTELQVVTRSGKLSNWGTQTQKDESHCPPSHSLRAPKGSYASVWEVHLGMEDLSSQELQEIHDLLTQLIRQYF